MDMETLKPIIAAIMESGWKGPAFFVAIWPLAGLIAMTMLQAQWMITLLGRSLSWGRSTGVGISAMPKTGIMRILFAPGIYAGIYLLALGMAVMDGILSKLDDETMKLVYKLIAALRKAGAQDHLLYFRQKTLDPEQAETVKVMQKALAAGASTVDAAQIAIITEAKIAPPAP